MVVLYATSELLFIALLVLELPITPAPRGILKGLILWKFIKIATKWAMFAFWPRER